MARLYYDAQGNPTRLLRSDAEVARHGAPAGAAGFIEFDEETNAAAIDALSGVGSQWQDHAVVGGQLRRNGAAVAIAPDGATRTVRKDFADNADAMRDDLQTIVDTVDASTNAQLRDMVKRIARYERRILRRLAQLSEQ